MLRLQTRLFNVVYLGSWSMDDMISFDFTLDNILSVKAPKGTDPDTLHDRDWETDDIMCHDSSI